jgi:hypothetical protein
MGKLVSIHNDTGSGVLVLWNVEWQSYHSLEESVDGWIPLQRTQYTGIQKRSDFAKELF